MLHPGEEQTNDWSFCCAEGWMTYTRKNTWYPGHSFVYVTFVVYVFFLDTGQDSGGDVGCTVI